NKPTNVSRILVAVSATSDPNGTWYYTAINSKTTIGGNDTWADYPGLAVDSQAVYITANMFRFGTGSYQGTRLWLVAKGLAGGLYAGGAASTNVYDPAGTLGITSQVFTLQPAQMYGTAPAGVGTFLVSYAGLSNGTNEFVKVIGVNNPLGAISFTQQSV